MVSESSSGDVSGKGRKGVMTQTYEQWYNWNQRKGRKLYGADLMAMADRDKAGAVSPEAYQAQTDAYAQAHNAQLLQQPAGMLSGVAQVLQQPVALLQNIVPSTPQAQAGGGTQGFLGSLADVLTGGSASTVAFSPQSPGIQPASPGLPTPAMQAAPLAAPSREPEQPESVPEINPTTRMPGQGMDTSAILKKLDGVIDTIDNGTRHADARSTDNNATGDGAPNIAADFDDPAAVAMARDFA